MTRYLLFLALPVLALALGWQLISNLQNTAHQTGYQLAQSEQRDLELDQLKDQIHASQRLLEQAHATSQALNQLISTRRQTDAKTTQEIRDALALTAEQRRDCTYDADSLQHLHTAYQRALQAVASGLAHPMPTAGGHDE